MSLSVATLKPLSVPKPEPKFKAPEGFSFMEKWTPENLVAGCWWRTDSKKSPKY